MTTKTASKTRGRPKGAANQKPDHVDGQLTRCPRCQSTDREPYFRTAVATYAGTDPAGKPFSHIVRRWTRCAACGQVRIDRVYENRTGAKK